MEKKDWCTKFPEYWYSWSFKKIYIGDCCKKHDDVDDDRGGCDSTAFMKCLLNKRIMGGSMIFAMASLACWVKYPFKMKKRV